MRMMAIFQAPARTTDLRTGKIGLGIGDGGIGAGEVGEVGADMATGIFTMLPTRYASARWPQNR